MSVTVPNALSLASIADGAAIVASDHRNNYSAVQVGVNGLIAMFTAAPVKGDLIVSAGGGSFDKLGVGTDGQSLVADSTQTLGVKWGGGGVTMLADSTLAVAAAAFDTNTILGGNIPTGYKHLRIEFELRGDAAVADVEARLTLNNDTGANYSAGGGFLGDNSATAYLGGGGLAFMPLSGTNIPAASLAAGIAAGGAIDIFNYRGTTFHKSAAWIVRGETATVRMVAVGSGRWANAAAITRIALTASTGNWLAGSRFTLYGLA